MANSILYMHNVKASSMTLTGDNGSNSAQVTATSDHAEVACRITDNYYYCSCTDKHTRSRLINVQVNILDLG